MSEKNLFDKMSLIDVAYVEAAVYPEAPQKMPLTSRQWWKPVAATAAALVLGVCCLRFSPQVKAFAAEFLNASVLFNDGEKAEGKMNRIHINEGITEEQVTKTYYNLEEVEELFGIMLLKSSKTTEKPIPHVNIFAINHGGYIEVDDTHYYLYNRVITDLSEHGATTHDTGEGAYTISYNAAFLTDRTEEGTNGYEGHYEDSRVVDHYTTANGLEATLFADASSLTAVIFHDNIRYKLSIWGTARADVLEEYLETLS